MKEVTEMRYCERCGKETEHTVREDALEIEVVCQECNKEEEMIKTFF